MVKRIAHHNSHVAWVPLHTTAPMIANWRFERHTAKPGLIRQHTVTVKASDFCKPTDPFALRNSFWQVHDEGAMLDFLNQTGIPWGADEAFFTADVFKFQEFTRRAVKVRVSQWQKLPGGSVWYADAIASFEGILTQPLRNGDMETRFHYSDMKQAILTSIVLDKHQKNRYRICKKPGCGLPFKVDIRQRRQYCSEPHRQAEAMRRYRKHDKPSRKGK
jgi:predicted RNA-binding Zn ribbon-like protein